MTSTRLTLRALLAIVVAALCLGLSTASAARAQLGPARAALAEADFERAERAFGRALAAPAITRDELVAILEGRAMARWALGDEAGARGDLAALGSLEPAHALPPEAPPPLVSALAEVARERLAIALLWEEHEGEVFLHVAIRDDAAHLVERVRVHARNTDGWAVTEERDVAVPSPRGARPEVWVEALGPGGAVLAQEGSASAPVSRGAERRSEARTTLADPEAERDDSALWIGLGVGAAVVLAIAIGVGVAVGTAQSDLTQPAAPVLIGF
jgi:hypothetical protein